MSAVAAAASFCLGAGILFIQTYGFFVGGDLFASFASDRSGYCL